MSDVVKIIVNTDKFVQWFVFKEEIINAQNVVDISFNDLSIIFCYAGGETNHMNVSNPKKTFQAIQEIIAGKQKESV